MWGEDGSENNSGCIKRDQGGAEEERRGRRRRRKEGREEKRRRSLQLKKQNLTQGVRKNLPKLFPSTRKLQINQSDYNRSLDNAGPDVTLPTPKSQSNPF